jgi:signal peptidase II
MKKIIIILVLFFIDRITKMYLIHLQGTGIEVDFYVFPFLNFFLIWNTGIGFGLMSMEANLYYHIITALIVLVNLVLVYYLMKSKNIQSYFILLVIGGSLGNLFDRIYYYAVPDFIDFHIMNYHWFVFNIADIFITIGIIGLLILELLKKENQKTNV